MSNLGVLTGGSESWAFGLNDSDVVVGTSNVTGGAFHAFVWDSTNGMRDLNNLLPGGSGWTLIRATDINNDGFITGWGTNGSGDTRAFLLTPTCAAGGGGAAAVAPPVLASGAGVTDEQGEFSDLALDADLRQVGSVEVLADQPGLRVEYELVDASLGPDAGRPNPATGAGFAEGLAFARTLKVSTSPAEGEIALTVAMTFTLDEIEALGPAADELELHVLDEAANSPIWRPAGRFIGQGAPTGVSGESGYIIYDDETVDFWAVRDAGGVFAVGRAAAAPPVERPPVPSPCGIAMIQPFLMCLLGLACLQRSRRA
jgi:probable HAF family extracellular repeat protein